MNGILLIDKPAGWTSSDVVAKLRGILHERRIGHSGTLDPMATGLLVVFVGRATRAVEFAENHSKRYIAGLKLGFSTDTQDTSGSVLRQSEEVPDKEALLKTLDKFRGNYEQIPPMYSAIKINGRKLYEIARKGGEVERKPRSVFISSLELVDGAGKDYILDVSCSKGTYIRTLCNDIGDALGCGACMSSLRREQAGDFTIDRAYSLEQIQQAADKGEAEKLLLKTDMLFEVYPELLINSAAEKKLRNGNIIKITVADGVYRVYSANGEFLALCKAQNNELKTIKSFFEV